jgi:hypothetical protein
MVGKVEEERRRRMSTKRKCVGGRGKDGWRKRIGGEEKKE